jgi:membrane protein DedA with SNARE-associated domain
VLLYILMLFFAASLHEDIAILMAFFFVVEHDLPLSYGLVAVYAGAVINNYVIYGVGAAARRLPGVRRWLIGERVERVRQRLKKHLVSTVVVCRFIPGSLSPAILGCGWLGVPFARFAVTIAISAALYVALIGAVVFTLGETVMHRVSKEAWPVLLVLIALAAIVAAYRLLKERRSAAG